MFDIVVTIIHIKINPSINAINNIIFCFTIIHIKINPNITAINNFIFLLRALFVSNDKQFNDTNLFYREHLYPYKFDVNPRTFYFDC